MAEKQVKIKLSEEGAERVKSSLGGVDSGLKSLASSALAMGAAYFSTQGVINALKYSVQQSMAGESAAKRLEVAYGRSTKSLIDFATARQLVTKFDDDGNIAAMAAISAFTQQEGAIKALTIAAQDMAEAKGMDLVSAAELLAKTFGSETNALKRSGIEVDATAGSMERLQQITQGVADLFGGQATAAADTLEGRLVQTQNAIDDTAQAIGDALAPAIKGVLPEIQGLAETWSEIATSGTEANEIFIKLRGVSLALASPMAALVKLTAGIFLPEDKEHLYEYREEAEKLSGQTMPKTIKELQILEASLRKKGMYEAADATKAYQEQLGRAVAALNAANAVEAAAAKKDKAKRLEQEAAAQEAAAEAAEAETKKRNELADALKREKEARAEAQAQRLLDAMIAAKEARMNIAAPEGFDPTKSPPLPDDFNAVVDDGTAAMEKFNAELSQSAALSIEDMLAKQAYREAVVSQTSVMLGSFSALAGHIKGGALASKRLAQASATIDMFAGANKAFAQGGVLGFITAASIIAAGMANIAQIEAQQFADGGFVRGHGGRRSDMVPANLSAGEGILTASTVARIGGEAAITALNAGGGAGGGVVINFTGPVTDRAFVRDYIVPEVRRAVGRGMA